jgi:hypothetical protein
MSKDIYFVVETTIEEDSRKLEQLRPDKDGWYRGIPVMAFGVVTRNNTCYDTDHVIKCINNKNTLFNIRLDEGNLFGEWNHKFVYPQSKRDLAKAFYLDRMRESNSYRKFYTKHVEDLGVDMIFCDTKPSGEHGKFFEELLHDPTRNLAFSLRGFADEKLDKKTNVMHKYLKVLITFDSGVPSGGFKYASKRYVDKNIISEESMSDIKVPVDKLIEIKNDRFEGLSMESAIITDSEINDILKSKKVVLKNNITSYIVGDKIYNEEENKKMSVFSTFIDV